MQPDLPKKLWPFIWHFLKPYKLFVIIFVLFAGASGLFAPLNSILIKHIIDTVGTLQSDKVASVLFWPAVCFVLIYEFHSLCWRGMDYINYNFQPVIKNKIISDTFGYIHQHAHQFFQDNLAGWISNQINILADNIERIVNIYSANFVRCIFLMIVSLISMYYVNPKFFYVLLIWILIFSAFNIWLSRRVIYLSELHAASESNVSGRMVDSITNANSIKIFSRRIYEIFYLQQALLLTKKAFQKKEMFIIKQQIFQSILLSTMLGFMVYFLVKLREKQLVSTGDFALILVLSSDVGITVWWALEQLEELNKAVGKCKQSLASLFLPFGIKDKENATNLHVTKGEITFSKVKFHYKATAPIFQDTCVTIKGGQKVGLVGYSGSGKSTFVNLIFRLYDVIEGLILIDGQDVSQCTQDSLRSNIAMIPQDPSLFHRSLMENIRYGRLEAIDEEVIEAAKRAHAHEFIIKLPQSYESLVGERGIKLSGGQRQRIAIARAILKAAPILILDEATSQLDSLTENEIRESLAELMQGKTTIVIAHRLSTLLRMDRILVFDEGKIVEDGSHEELLAHGGLYQTLWNAQIGGFLPDKR